MLNIQLHRHEDNCGLHALVAQTRQRYAGHLEEWILQEPGDCSPERPGEVFKTGVIRVVICALGPQLSKPAADICRDLP